MILLTYMEIITIQSLAFKNLFDVLKDIVQDVNMYFTPDGVRIASYDTAKVALIDITLYAKNFEKYTCPGKYIVGINVANTYKLLKTIVSHNTLTLSIKSPDVLTMEIYNDEKKTSTKYQLKLLEIDEEEITNLDLDTTYTTSLKSVDFQKICREMLNLNASSLRIQRAKNYITITCEGDYANQETTIVVDDVIDFELDG